MLRHQTEIKEPHRYRRFHQYNGGYTVQFAQRQQGQVRVVSCTDQQIRAIIQLRQGAAQEEPQRFKAPHWLALADLHRSTAGNRFGQSH